MIRRKKVIDDKKQTYVQSRLNIKHIYIKKRKNDMTKKMVMPWEDRPAGCADVMWRYSKNPVIDRYHIPSSNSIFNSAVVPF